MREPRAARRQVNGQILAQRVGIPSMSTDPKAVQRLVQALAEILEERVAPLRAEIAELRRIVERLTAQAGAPAPARPVPEAARAVAPASKLAAVGAPGRGRVARAGTRAETCEVPGCQ